MPQLARVAVGKAPSEKALAARTLVPAKLEDDEALYERRSLSMTWTRGKRELAISGRLPLEQGAASSRPSGASPRNSAPSTSRPGWCSSWQQSAADALVTLARATAGAASGVRRSPTTLIVHLSEDARRCSMAPARSGRTAELVDCDTRRLDHQAERARLVHSRVGRCASTRSSARCTSAQRTARTPAAPPPANSKHTTSPRWSWAARPSSTTSSCSAPPPQAPPRPPHPHQRHRPAARVRRRIRTHDRQRSATRTAG